MDGRTHFKVTPDACGKSVFEETIDAKPPAPCRPPEAWEQHDWDGRMPNLPDCPVCVQETWFCRLTVRQHLQQPAHIAFGCRLLGRSEFALQMIFCGGRS